jgi:predicted ABC-type ATPase
LLKHAASVGIEIYVWYAGLSTPELHVERVRARVRQGGHDIPESDIRRRYEHSRSNLIALLPHLEALRVYDNSAEGDPVAGNAPQPTLVLHMEKRTVLGPADLSDAPDWAKAIVNAAIKMSSR